MREIRVWQFQILNKYKYSQAINNTFIKSKKSKKDDNLREALETLKEVRQNVIITSSPYLARKLGFN